MCIIGCDKPNLGSWVLCSEHMEVWKECYDLEDKNMRAVNGEDHMKRIESWKEFRKDFDLDLPY